MKKTIIAILIFIAIVSCATESPFKIRPDVSFEPIEDERPAEAIEMPVFEIIPEAEETDEEPFVEEVEEIIQEEVEEPSEAILEPVVEEIEETVEIHVTQEIVEEEPKTIMQHFEDTMKGTDEPHEAIIGDTVLPMWFVYTAAFLFLCILFTMCYIAKQKRFRSYRGD